MFIYFSSNSSLYEREETKSIIKYECLFKRGASEAAKGCLARVAAKLVKTATKILTANFQTYIRVKINRAGKFGPFLLDFRTLSKITSKYTYMWK